MKWKIKEAPTRTITVKNNTNDWFDGGIVEIIDIWDELFIIFKAKRSLDEVLYKEARKAVQALIKDKKNDLGKPKRALKI